MPTIVETSAADVDAAVLGGLPERLPYRLLTGTDDRAFCEKVSAALLDGYVLHGSPTICWDGTRTITAQAVVLAEG